MLKNLINLLFPSLCYGCDSLLLTNESILCTNCRHELPFTNHHQTPNNEITKKFYGRLPLEHSSSLVYFQKEGIVQNIIHNLKYKGNQEIGTLLGEMYTPHLKDINNMFKFDEIIPVPLHPKKEKERGYNQVTTFCTALSKELEIPVNSDLLKRIVYSKTQTKKNLSGRTEINSEIFQLSNPPKKGKHYLLIDDVITSGATLEVCGRALLTIPNSKLSIITIAYAQ